MRHSGLRLLTEGWDRLYCLREMLLMGELFMLSENGFNFPLLHGMPKVDDRWILSGIPVVPRHAMQWRDPLLHLKLKTSQIQ
tara:strand:- start:181 stop:426 length:246 start_codon:yes stop_codon:yes gene_type:complete